MLKSFRRRIRDQGDRRWRALPESVGHDARMALRRLAAAPLFTFFAVISLGLGLGATACITGRSERRVAGSVGRRRAG